MTAYKSLVVLKSLTIHNVRVLKNKVSATYSVEQMDGTVNQNEFTYSYDEDIFDPQSGIDQNLASMMMAQVAINFGLFCQKIVFDGLFDSTDRRFILTKIENTSREIFVNKFLFENVFLLDEVKNIDPEKRKKYTNAQVEFRNTDFTESSFDWKHVSTDKNKHVILSSGGKDSLLSYGLLKELNKEVHPVFINESGRHWFTAINSFRYFKEHEPNVARVWSNSDRMFNWMLRQLPFIRKDFSNVRADDYPIRLWTVAVFLFGTLPLVRKRGAGRIVIGDEYDSTQKTSYNGITHYNGLYDQSRYFDNSLSRYYLKKGWNISQFSLLRPLSELLILKILTKRYPHLQEHQVSCHASHEKEGRMYPCGNCEKCRRIVGMLRALSEDPSRCGYTPEQQHKALASLESKKVKQLGLDAAHLYHLLLEKEIIKPTDFTKKLAKEYPYILMLRFDHERSLFTDIPVDLRKPLFSIYLNYTGFKAVRLTNRKWEMFDVLDAEDVYEPFPFEQIMPNPGNSNGNASSFSKNYLWAELTWPEIQERLKTIDTALLPCGSIEQHGRHLPVDIDFFDADYLARRVAEACSEPKPFVVPAVPYGVSYHHEDFKGTISVSNESLSRFIYDVGMGLARNGIKKLVIINGHGDNAPTLNFAAQMINRDAGIFVCVDTGETSDKDVYRMIRTPNDIHAGEFETSTSLAVRPHLVKLEQAKEKTVSFENPYLDFSSSRGVPWYVRTKLISDDGVIGNPLQASAEKGEKLWEIMVAHLVKFVEEIKNTDPENLYQRKY